MHQTLAEKTLSLELTLVVLGAPHNSTLLNQ